MTAIDKEQQDAREKCMGAAEPAYKVYESFNAKRERLRREPLDYSGYQSSNSDTEE